MTITDEMIKAGTKLLDGDKRYREQASPEMLCQAIYTAMRKLEPELKETVKIPTTWGKLPPAPKEQRIYDKNGKWTGGIMIGDPNPKSATKGFGDCNGHDPLYYEG